MATGPTVVAGRTGICLTMLGFAPLPCTSQAPRLEITYLGNMGVLLESGGRRIVIDGFHHGALREYASVPPSLLDPLERSRAPFRTLTLVLTTHRHLDHFEAASVAARLRSDSAVIFVAAQETVDSLFARTDAVHPGGSSRVRGVTPTDHGEVPVPVEGFDLTVLDLPHNPTRSKRVANVGFLLDLGGVRVLHVGDADPTVTNFDPHRLSRRAIDVAIVPFWYLTGGNAAVLRSIGAKTWIASHASPSDSASIRREVLAKTPGAIVLATPGEHHRIP